jgi:2,3-diaminopropionate biosynthesis protein SbnA
MDFEDRIGNTPVRLVRACSGSAEYVVRLKLEGENPGGSVKDRTARGLVQALDAERRLTADTVVVESTSGNLGISLAALAKVRRFRFKAVVDPRTPASSVATMRRLGAEVERVDELDPSGGYLLTRLARVQVLCEGSSRTRWANQYASEANPRVHRQETAPEIDRQSGEIDALFIAVSTGGTLAGIAAYYRSIRPETRIIAVDAAGSAVFDDRPRPRRLTGIGASRKSAFIEPWHYDDYVLVSDPEAFAFCRALAADTGIWVGGSSGAVVCACMRYLATHPELKRPLCLCPDEGHKYRDTIYSNQWIANQGLEMSAALLAPLPGGDPVMFELEHPDGSHD